MNLPEEVIQAVNQGKCILVVGSHASNEARILAGEEPLSEKKMAREMSGRRMPLREAAGVMEREQGRAALMDYWRKERACEGVAPTNFHQLALRRFPRIFTTTQDDLLERAATAMGGQADVYYRGQRVPEADPARRAVIKLWGGMERPDTLMISDADFRRAPYTDEFRKSLRKILREHVVFFVGFRPADAEFDVLWDELSSAYGGELPRCHLAVPQGKISDVHWQKWVWRGLLPFTADPSEALEFLETRIAG
jgi:hypothetical protein